MAKRTLRIGVSLVLMVVLMGWFLLDADLVKMLRELRKADPTWLIAGTLLALLSYWLRACRWQMILLPVDRVKHRNVLLATAVGYAGMTLLPARLGDIVRPVLLARRERISVSATLASVLTERIFDLWTVVFYFIVFLIWPPAIASSLDSAERLRLLTTAGWLLGGAVLAGTALLLALLRYQERFIAVATAPVAWLVPRWREPVARFWGHFLAGLRVLQRPRDLLLTTVGSLILWLVIYWQLQTTLLAFAFDLPLRACFFVVAGSIIGLAIPTPGAVGGFHKALELSLSFFVVGASAQVVKSFVVAHHAICFLPITLIGLVCLPFLGISFGQLTEGAELGDKGTDGITREAAKTPLVAAETRQPSGEASP